MGWGNRYEKISEAEDHINCEQLRALEPVGSSVAGDLAADKYREKHHQDEARRKSEIERNGTNEQTCEHQNRGHQESNLYTRTDRNRQRKVHPVLHCSSDRGGMLGRVSHDRNDKD